MPKCSKPYQPGAVLHSVIVGALRASGSSFEAWCKQNGVKPATARTATYGQSGGETGAALLDKIIEAAGRDMVEMAYSKRIRAEVARLEDTSK
ncbi:hypothetical protein [Phaeobacter sp. HF9A]|uniref:hypothetical protein n=1 Tax=Phaeobacter sp. HF9A TaxID=2721561 RepID=UPI0014311509|nr:hypothetical protein [Phaeobacter sp. HF9A]NIZ13937.1 hypothetical protein [Phaeobacter sp. HF9A]